MDNPRAMAVGKYPEDPGRPSDRRGSSGLVAPALSRGAWNPGGPAWGPAAGGQRYPRVVSETVFPGCSEGHLGIVCNPAAAARKTCTSPSSRPLIATMTKLDAKQ